MSLEEKEIMQDYVLISYDIPCTNNKLRMWFVRKLHQLGAIKRTDSDYLIPYSDKVYELVSKVAEEANVDVWRSHMDDKATALEITESYGQAVLKRLEYIELRITMAQDHINAGRLSAAKKMGIRTGKLLDEVAQISETYHPQWLEPKLMELVMAWKKLYE